MILILISSRTIGRRRGVRRWHSGKIPGCRPIKLMLLHGIRFATTCFASLALLWLREKPGEGTGVLPYFPRWKRCGQGGGKSSYPSESLKRSPRRRWHGAEGSGRHRVRGRHDSGNQECDLGHLRAGRARRRSAEVTMCPEATKARIGCWEIRAWAAGILTGFTMQGNDHKNDTQMSP